MPANDNGSQLPALVRYGLWIYTVVIVLSVLYLVLSNPGNFLGEGNTYILWGFRFQTYPGQSTIVGFLGTFIVAMGVMVSLIERRLTGSVHPFVSIPAMAGAIVIMTGQVIQGIEEGSLILVVVGLLLALVVPFWIPVAVWVGTKRAYSLLKSRVRSDC